jgi:hypothetical protein
MMKPKASGPHDEGLLEYLEDIIGSGKHVEQIEAGSKQLEELNEQRLSQVQRLKLVEKDREGLDGAKSEAEAYIGKERELQRCRGTLFQLFLGEARANVAKIEANKAELEAKLAHERCAAVPVQHSCVRVRNAACVACALTRACCAALFRSQREAQGVHRVAGGHGGVVRRR